MSEVDFIHRVRHKDICRDFYSATYTKYGPSDAPIHYLHLWVGPFGVHVIWPSFHIDFDFAWEGLFHG